MLALANGSLIEMHTPRHWALTIYPAKYFESARHYYECLVGEPRTFEIGLRASF